MLHHICLAGMQAGLSFPMSLLLSEKPSMTIANALCVVLYTENLV